MPSALFHFLTFDVDQSQPVAAFFGLFSANPNPTKEVFPPKRFIRLNVVSSYRAGSFDQLTTILHVSDCSPEHFDKISDSF